MGDKVSVILKELTAVDWQESQFPQQNIGAFFDAREQVHQLGIQVVIDAGERDLIGLDEDDIKFLGAMAISESGGDIKWESEGQ